MQESMESPAAMAPVSDTSSGGGGGGGDKAQEAGKGVAKAVATEVITEGVTAALDAVAPGAGEIAKPFIRQEVGKQVNQATSQAEGAGGKGGKGDKDDEKKSTAEEYTEMANSWNDMITGAVKSVGKNLIAPGAEGAPSMGGAEGGEVGEAPMPSPGAMG